MIGRYIRTLPPATHKGITLTLAMLLAIGFIISGWGKVQGIGIPPGYNRYTNLLHVIGYITGMADLLLATGLILKMYRRIAIIGVYVSLLAGLVLHSWQGQRLYVWSFVVVASLNTALLLFTFLYPRENKTAPKIQF